MSRVHPQGLASPPVNRREALARRARPLTVAIEAGLAVKTENYDGSVEWLTGEVTLPRRQARKLIEAGFARVAS